MQPSIASTVATDETTRSIPTTGPEALYDTKAAYIHSAVNGTTAVPSRHRMQRYQQQQRRLLGGEDQSLAAATHRARSGHAVAKDMVDVPASRSKRPVSASLRSCVVRQATAMHQRMEDYVSAEFHEVQPDNEQYTVAGVGSPTTSGPRAVLPHVMNAAVDTAGLVDTTTTAVQAAPMTAAERGWRNNTTQTEVIKETKGDLGHINLNITRELLEAGFEERQAVLEADLESKRTGLHKDMEEVQQRCAKQVIEAQLAQEAAEHEAHQLLSTLNVEQQQLADLRAKYNVQMNHNTQRIVQLENEVRDLTLQLDQSRKLIAIQENVVKRRSEADNKKLVETLEMQMNKNRAQGQMLELSKSHKKAAEVLKEAKDESQRVSEERLELEQRKAELNAAMEKVKEDDRRRQEAQRRQQEEQLQRQQAEAQRKQQSSLELSFLGQSESFAGPPLSSLMLPPAVAGTSQQQQPTAPSMPTFDAQPSPVTSPSRQRSKSTIATDRRHRAGRIFQKTVELTMAEQKQAITMADLDGTEPQEHNKPRAVSPANKRFQLLALRSLQQQDEAALATAASGSGDNHNNSLGGSLLQSPTASQHFSVPTSPRTNPNANPNLMRSPTRGALNVAIDLMDPDSVIGALTQQRHATNAKMQEMEIELTKKVDQFEAQHGASLQRTMEERLRAAITEASSFYETQFEEMKTISEEREKVLNQNWQDVVSNLEGQLTKKGDTIRTMHTQLANLEEKVADAERRCDEKETEHATLVGRIQRLHAALLGVEMKNVSTAGANSTETDTGDPALPSSAATAATSSAEKFTHRPGGSLCSLCRKGILKEELDLQYRYQRDVHGQQHANVPKNVDVWAPKTPKRPPSAKGLATATAGPSGFRPLGDRGHIQARGGVSTPSTQAEDTVPHHGIHKGSTSYGYMKSTGQKDFKAGTGLRQTLHVGGVTPSPRKKDL